MTGIGKKRRARIIAAALGVSMLTMSASIAADGDISTVAGGGTGDGGRATSAIVTPIAVVRAPDGTAIIAEPARIRKVDASGNLVTIAGTGTAGFSGDGGDARLAQVSYPEGLEITSDGSLLIADSGNNRIRKIDPSGIITTVAGNGVRGFSGDGGQATDASFSGPEGVSVFGADELLVADTRNHRIRKIAANGVVTTVVGTGVAGVAGDNGNALQAQLNQPGDVDVDSYMHIYIADTFNHRLRKVDPGGTIITMLGWPISATTLYYPKSISVSSYRDVFVADTYNHRVLKMTASWVVSTYAGRGAGGDGGPATSASLWYPEDVDFDTTGRLLIAETGRASVREVSPGGVIRTIAGTGSTTFAGDGGPANNAALWNPAGVEEHPDGGYVLADSGNNRIRRVSPNGTITTLAGDGSNASSGDGGPATSARVANPKALAVDPAGSIYFCEGNRVRKISPAGLISTVAGNGAWGNTGDGGPATSALLGGADGLAIDGQGNLFIASNDRIRKVNVSGTITTVAGPGSPGWDNLKRISDQNLWGVSGLDADDLGNLYFADSGHHRVARLSPTGLIETVAGTSQAGYSGDGGRASWAKLYYPADVSVAADNSLLIADSSNFRIRAVSPEGTITTVAGKGAWGNTGDGGPATSAWIGSVAAVSHRALGGFLFADSSNHRIRAVQGPPPIGDPEVVFPNLCVTIGALKVCSGQD